MAKNDMVRFDFGDAAAGIEAMLRDGPGVAANGMRVIGDVIISDVRVSSPGKGVPRDEGVLGASLRAVGPDRRGIVKLAAGGASAPYALRQHEELDYQHTVGEARYLVRGVERFAAGRTGNPRREMIKIADEIVKKAARRSGRRKGGS